MFGVRERWFKIASIWFLFVHDHKANADETGYCWKSAFHLDGAYDLRCSRHNYSDFRDTHFHDIYGDNIAKDHTCVVFECSGPFILMQENCPRNMTRECLKASRSDPKAPECFYLPGELPVGLEVFMPSLNELRISDELYLQNQILVREWRGIGSEASVAPEFFYIVNSTYNYIRSGRGNKSHCLEMEKSIDWCNDASKGRSFNGTYVLCREEKDLWRVMSEFGRRAPQCIRYYVSKNFLQAKESGDFKKDMTKVCSNFEKEMEVNKENDFRKTHTTERHSIAINTFDACCFLRKTQIIDKFPCFEEATTPWPETPAPTGELRNESNILVLSIEENGISSYSNKLVWPTIVLVSLF